MGKSKQQDSHQVNVGGMSCSFCAQTIEKAYDRTEGVDEVSVSLAHEEVLVKYDSEKIDAVKLNDTLRELGYSIRDPDKLESFSEQREELKTGRKRLIISGTATIASAVLMGYMIFFKGAVGPALMNYTFLGLALVTMFWPGYYIKEKAYYSLRRGILNQHVLLEAGAFAALAGGLLGLLAFPSYPTVHFLAVAVFLTAYHILSEYTSLVVRTRASRAVQDLLDLRPDTARRVRDGKIDEVEVDELEVGDKVRVKPGEKVPIDGEVREGSGAVDESVVTGEPTPVDKREGDEVIGGSINKTGTLLMEVTATGDETFLNQVAHQMKEARAMKPGVMELADRILQYFVPAVLAVGGFSLVFWIVGPLLWGGGPDVQRGVFATLSALVLGYPCALGMATPLALIRGGGEAANRGILMRSGDAFQIFHEAKNIVLDKTGTITEGEPAVEEVLNLSGEEEEILRYGASAESFSEHPLADALIDYANNRGVEFPEPASFDSVTGKGVEAVVEGEAVLVGKPNWLKEKVGIETTTGELKKIQGRGLTAIGIVVEGELIGLVGIGDRIKKDAPETISRIKDQDITPVMITGDSRGTAAAVASEVGINRVQAEVLPEEKRKEIGKLQEEGRVVMVGDGINDSPALTQADIGIAIGAGTDIAIKSADIVLVGDRLGGVMEAYDIGKTSYRKTKQNLIVAFGFNGIGVPAAVTGLVHPGFAMVAMVTSVTAVLANSFLGQLIKGGGINADFRVGDVEEVNKLKEDKTEKKGEAVFGVNLHCIGCEQRVTESLSEKKEVREVKADHEEKRVEININPAQLNDSILNWAMKLR